MTKEPEEEPVFKLNLAAFVAFFFGMAWIDLFPSVIAGYFFFTTFPFSFNPLYLLTLIPLFLVLYGIALLTSLIASKIGIWIVHKRITYPETGNYPLSMDEPQIRAFTIKGHAKTFGRWLYYFFHINFLRVFWLRRMGVKIGKNVKIGRSIEDEEFQEFGDNGFMARETVFGGHLMDNFRLLIFKTLIGKNCIFEHISGAVRGKLGDNSIIKHASSVMNGQICRGNAIYQGVPCKKVADNNLSPEELETLKQTIREIDKINFINRKNAPIKINETHLFIMKGLIILGGCLFAWILPYLYSLFFTAFYSPSNHLLNIVLLLPIPFIFLITIGFFIAGTTLFTKIFIAYYDRKAEIPDGYYELDDPRAKWFKIKYFLRLFGLKLFKGTPFKIAIFFALRLWGKVKLGKNVWIDCGNFDPQYLEVGDYSHFGQGARVHTHDIVNGKLYIKTVKIGKNILLGGYCHLRPGVEIADGSIVGIGAWCRKDRIFKHRSLLLGKPAYELPIKFVTKAATAKDRYVD